MIKCPAINVTSRLKALDAPVKAQSNGTQIDVDPGMSAK